MFSMLKLKNSDLSNIINNCENKCYVSKLFKINYTNINSKCNISHDN